MPVVELVIKIMDFIGEVEDFVDARVEDIEKLFKQLREDFPPLDIFVIYVEMNVGIYEVVRSLIQVFDFVGYFFTAVVNAFKDINIFLVAVDLPPIDLGFELPTS